MYPKIKKADFGMHACAYILLELIVKFAYKTIFCKTNIKFQNLNGFYSLPTHAKIHTLRRMYYKELCWLLVVNHCCKVV